MTGLEKMKSQILEEAKTAAEKKLADARAEAEEIIAGAREEAQKSVAGISRKSEAAVTNYKERVISSNDLKRRTKILAAKQEVIADVLDKAYRSLESMDQEAYFDMLVRMAGKYAQPQDGEMILSPQDRERLPEDFAARVAEAGALKGGSLKVSEGSRNIENGFVLVYGGIEENCTLRAMFDEKKDELSDKVYRILFA